MGVLGQYIYHGATFLADFTGDQVADLVASELFGTGRFFLIPGSASSPSGLDFDALRGTAFVGIDAPPGGIAFAFTYPGRPVSCVARVRIYTSCMHTIDMDLCNQHNMDRIDHYRIEACADRSASDRARAHLVVSGAS